MRSSVLLIACCLSQLSARPTHAATPPGAISQEIKPHYASSESLEATLKSSVLSLQDVDYDGVRWSSVRFIFGPARRLQSLTMSTRMISYSELIARVRRGNGPPELLSAAAQNPSAAFQTRICDEGDGRVTLTYEPVTTPT